MSDSWSSCVLHSFVKRNECVGIHSAKVNKRGFGLLVYWLWQLKEAWLNPNITIFSLLDRLVKKWQGAKFQVFLDIARNNPILFNKKITWTDRSTCLTYCGKTLELFCNWRYAGQSKMEEFVRKLVKTSDLRYTTLICFNKIKEKISSIIYFLNFGV